MINSRNLLTRRTFRRDTAAGMGLADKNGYNIGSRI